MLSKKVLYSILIVSLLIFGCSNKQDDVKVTPTMLFEKVNDEKQEDIYALLVSVSSKDIQTDFYFHEFQAYYLDIFESFDAPGELDLDKDTCTELTEKVKEEQSEQRISTCQYVKYTKEGEEQAKKAKIHLKLYSYEGELLLEYEGKLFDDFESIKDN